MRKVILSNLISLDGFFEGPNKEFDWFRPDEEFFEYSKELLGSVDTLLFGKITYEMMAAYWPVSNDPDAGRMNSLQKIVFSKTLHAAEWNNSTLVRGDATEEILKLKQKKGKDMAVLGSQKLMISLMQKNLIDEYHIIVTPLLLGNGHLLFNGLEKKLNLQLQKTRSLKSGVVILYYKPI